MDANQAQTLFFNHIKSKIPSHLALVEEVADLLNISNDSAYRRIRGEKPIGLDEMQVLCNKYHVSLDKLLQLQTNTVIFSGNKVDITSFGFIDYLADIVDNLVSFNAFTNPRMYYATKDIPIFHFMQFPELREFKFFFWKRTLIGHPELARRQFDGEKESDEALEYAKKIVEQYVRLPSIELWGEETVNVTIRQIEFYRQSDIFADSKILLKVYEQLEELLNHLEQQAENGRKFLYGQADASGGATYEMYVNECLIGDNAIFVQGDNRQISVLNHNGLNFISTQDKSFCDYTFKHMQNVIRKSTAISQVGEKDRSVFFNTLRAKIYNRIKNIR